MSNSVGARYDSTHDYGEIEKERNNITYYREASDRFGPLGPDQSYRGAGPDHHLVIMRSLTKLNLLRIYLTPYPVRSLHIIASER